MMRSSVWFDMLLVLAFIPQGHMRKGLPFHCKYKPSNDIKDINEEILPTFSTTSEGTRQTTATPTPLEYSTRQTSHYTTGSFEEILSTLSITTEGTRQTTVTPASLEYSRRQTSHFTTDEKFSSTSLFTTERKMATTGSTNKEMTSLQHSTHLMSTSDSTSDVTIAKKLIIEPVPDLEVLICPANMVITGCDVCEVNCEDPTTCSLPFCENSGWTCACESGLFRKGSECVPISECGCYYQGEFLTVGEARVNDDCSELCECIYDITLPSLSYNLPEVVDSNSMLACTSYSCAYGAECAVKNGVGPCYCSTSTGFYGDGSQCSKAYDCSDIYKAGYTDSGVYTIRFTSSGYSSDVYCNMTDGEGWTVIQRRVDGAVDFNRNWTSYKEGFGDMEHEFWYGNEDLYFLTKQKNYTLRIDLATNHGAFVNITYGLFKMTGESNNYKLTYVGDYTGHAGADVLSDSVYDEFSTYDRDNDKHLLFNCAADEERGAWWYGDCATGVDAGLNGKYYINEGIIVNDGTFSYVEMKLVPKAEVTDSDSKLT